MEGNFIMYQIGICDDEVHTCSELEYMIRKIMKNMNIKCDIEHWYSGESLCQYLDMGNHLDLIFLDIELVSMNGLDVGKYIRNTLDDLKTYIIYISYNQSYAMQLFKIQPLDFLVKPFKCDEVMFVLKIFIRIAEKKRLFLEYHIGNSYYKQPIDDIIYLQSDNKKIHIVLPKEKKEFYGKLKSIVTQMPSHFLQIHQSYIINQNYVTEYTYDEIIMRNGEQLKISRPYRNIIRKILISKRNYEDGCK